ncbi:MAG: DUF1800 domain-containing protein [Ferrovibrio sp.]
MSDSSPSGLGGVKMPSRRDFLRCAALALANASCAAIGHDRPVPPHPESVWRACSRLGYAPTARLADELAQAADLRDWALAQIGLARARSQQAAQIETELAEFAAPLPELFAAERAEREARQQITPGTEEAAAFAARQAEGVRRLDFAALAHPALFSRRVALKAAIWRLQAACDPTREPPLLARMTEFWFNHFNVFEGKAGVRPFVGHYQLHAIRAHALGRFADLLLATARHPAMLRYLDQAQSVAEKVPDARGRQRGLNENYAREVMELHTLGVDGGYTQNDVRALSRVLTGWTVDTVGASGFRFAARLHDEGTKTVLGRRYPGASGAGEAEGIEALRDLAQRPATARRIADRLARFFVSDQPPPRLTERLAQRYLATDGDIAAVLEALFSSVDFWAADQRLFKTPLDYACAALAMLDATNDRTALSQTLAFLSAAGQPLNGWPTPDGYPFAADTWLTPLALTRRADHAFVLARNRPMPDFMRAFLSSETRARLEREKPALQAALMLISPESMWK